MTIGEKTKEIGELYNQGFTIGEIAEKYGLTESSIQKRIRTYEDNTKGAKYNIANNPSPVERYAVYEEMFYMDYGYRPSETELLHYIRQSSNKPKITSKKRTVGKSKKIKKTNNTIQSPYYNQYFVDSLVVTKTMSIEFSVKEHEGVIYGDIRKYVSGKSYTGPTKKGIQAPVEVFLGFQDKIKDLPDYDSVEEGEITKISSEDGHLYVLLVSILSGKIYLQMNRLVPGSEAFGHGIAIRYEQLDEFQQKLKTLIDSLNTEAVNELKSRDIDNSTQLSHDNPNIEGLSENVTKYF